MDKLSDFLNKLEMEEPVSENASDNEEESDAEKYSLTPSYLLEENMCDAKENMKMLANLSGSPVDSAMELGSDTDPGQACSLQQYSLDPIDLFPENMSDNKENLSLLANSSSSSKVDSPLPLDTQTKPRPSVLASFDELYNAPSDELVVQEILTDILERTVTAAENAGIDISTEVLPSTSGFLPTPRGGDADTNALQTEADQEINAYKEKIDSLNKRLEEKDQECEKLRESLQVFKIQQAKLLARMQSKISSEENFKKLLDRYEKDFAKMHMEHRKLMEEYAILKHHFTHLEIAFSDVHQKYEKCKIIIVNFKDNQATLKHALLSSEGLIGEGEGKLDALKKHASAEMEKCNQELQMLRAQKDVEIQKLVAIIKKLEIKMDSLEQSLNQKDKECAALSTLCDELTGNI